MIWLILACTTPATAPTSTRDTGETTPSEDTGDTADANVPDEQKTYPLAEAAGLLTGSRAKDAAGSAFTGLGDINGDGMQDVAISSTARNTNAGAVHILLGPLNGEHDIEQRAWLTLSGAKQKDYTGLVLAPVADLTGDGVSELLIGSPQDVTHTPTQSPFAGPGMAFLLTGLTGETTLTSPTARLLGDIDQQRMGASVADAGDLNGDGLTDLIIGASSTDSQTGTAQAGAAGVFLSPLSGDIALSDADALLFGNTERAQVGSAVASAGDLNGDGYMDVVVGADADSQLTEGRVYAFFGPLTGVRPASLADAVLVGQTPGDAAGSTIISGIDTDGDGRSELLINAYEDHGSGPQSGSVYLVGGPISGTHSLPDIARLHLTGADGDKHFGEAISAGDLNGDALDDILVSCHEHADGVAYLFYGPLSGERAYSTADVLFPAIDADINTGWAVSADHDTDGDGLDDLLLSANKGGDDKHGLVYLIPGADL